MTKQKVISILGKDFESAGARITPDGPIESISYKTCLLYTSFPRSDVYANGTGTCKDAPIVVLTDEISASASEIFSGAIQDNDRGTDVYKRQMLSILLDRPDRP